MFFQIAHDPVTGSQAEGRAAREKQGIDSLGGGQWVQKRRLSGGRASAPDRHPSTDINTSFCTVVEEQNRHTGHGLIILGVADAKTLKISNGNLSDRVE